ARRREPITNVYQTERSQEVLLCLDSGRMMGNPVGRGTALDQAIDASIVLAHVCHRSGDRVGMAVFGDTVQQFVRPASGESALRRMIDQLIEIEAEGVFPSYTALVSRIRALQKKRSLIFLFTDLNDPQLAANLAEVLPLISRRHVLVVVSLRDPLLDRIAAGAASDARSLHQVFAARELSRERAARVRELILAGVQVLEADADRLSLDVINRYLQVKARQMV
ncbi:MAG: hypothetical protein CMJ18_19475, partial [Phycisphaeraceae bacterium]|nr:hypothetical protein [Phycisphaeraceae bacterium]